MATETNIKSFETSLRRLEEISRLLENEEINLEESISLYEEGIELSKICFKQLKEAELKISRLKSNIEDSEVEGID